MVLKTVTNVFAITMMAWDDDNTEGGEKDKNDDGNE